MRVVIQRAGKAGVTTGDGKDARIGPGLLCLVGVAEDDDPSDAQALAKKTSRLRVFEDGSGRMNLDIGQTGGEVLSIPQFTLLGSLKKGSRPSFDQAAGPEKALELWELYNQALAREGLPVQKGFFGEHMKVSLVNEGPVTIILDSKK